MSEKTVKVLKTKNGGEFYPEVSVRSIVDIPEGGFAIQGVDKTATNTEIVRLLKNLNKTDISVQENEDNAYTIMINTISNE